MRQLGTLYAAKILKKIQDLLIISENDQLDIEELKSAERVLSFRNDPLINVIEKYKKKPIKGISPSVFSLLTEINNSKEPAILESLRSSLDHEYVELLKVKGLGAKKVLLIQKELQIKSIASLLTAINDKSILKVKGFAEKSTLTLKDAAEFYLGVREKIRLDQHENLIQLIKLLLDKKNIQLIEISDSLEKDEVFDRTELAIDISNKEELLSIMKENHFTLLSVDEKKIHLKKDHHSIFLTLCSTEELTQCISEATHKVETCNRKLSHKDIKGIIHSHTNYSDGLNTIEEMAHQCRELGYAYLAISDHSQSAKYANGINPERLLKQKSEIETYNSLQKNFRLFSCIESDILKNGELDYDSEILAQLDFVISSIHSHFELRKDDMTERIITAVKNPYTTILAHPTGRLLLERKGYDIDIEKVLSALKAHNKVLELNCNPKRLDLSWRHLGLAKELGVKVCLSPDAHSIEQIEYIQYGIMMAHKAGLTKSDIINCLDTEELENFICKTQTK